MKDRLDGAYVDLSSLDDHEVEEAGVVEVDRSAWIWIEGNVDGYSVDMSRMYEVEVVEAVVVDPLVYPYVDWSFSTSKKVWMDVDCSFSTS